MSEAEEQDKYISSESLKKHWQIIVEEGTLEISYAMSFEPWHVNKTQPTDFLEVFLLKFSSSYYISINGNGGDDMMSEFYIYLRVTSFPN